MGQILHGSAKTKHAVRAAIQSSIQECADDVEHRSRQHLVEAAACQLDRVRLHSPLPRSEFFGRYARQFLHLLAGVQAEQFLHHRRAVRDYRRKTQIIPPSACRFAQL